MSNATMSVLVCSTALLLTVLCFLVFAASILVPLFRQHPAAPEPEADVIEGAAKATEALAKLVDSMAKAGPSVLCLTGSFFFIFVAFLSRS